jgi:signal transduction histidine kinase
VREAAKRTDVANIRLVEMEHQSFDLVKEGRAAEARSLLFSQEYEEQKAVYAAAITECKRVVQRRVDEQLGHDLRRALIGLALTLAALVTLALGWERVVRLVRQSFADRLVLQGRLEDAIRARDEFLSIASHELKTPLTTLKLQVQSMGVAVSRDTRPDARSGLEKKVAKTERQVERLSNLIDELLDASRITSGRMILSLDDDVDLSEVIAEAVDRFKDELIRAGSEIRVRGIDVPIRGRWDRLRLDQVLSNLITNALKYGEGRPIEIAAEASERVAYLTVCDHGIGISPENQALIFQRFERAVPEREYGGFGLGLWIVREIAVAMGGEVSVTSRLGEGATFRVVLPRKTGL